MQPGDGQRRKNAAAPILLLVTPFVVPVLFGGWFYQYADPCLFDVIEANDSLLANVVHTILPTVQACETGVGLSGTRPTTPPPPPPRSITVKLPNGGETLLVGHTVNLQWTSNIGDGVRIEISRDGGTTLTYSTLFVDTDNDGSQLWTVTGPVSNKVLFRITSNIHPTIKDTSDAVAAIVDPCDPARPSDQCAHYTTGFKWPATVRGIAYVFDTSRVPADFTPADTTAWMEAVERAVAPWNAEIRARIQFVRGNPLIQQCGGIAGDNTNCIAFRDIAGLGLAESHVQRVPFTNDIREVDLDFDIQITDAQGGEFFWGHCNPNCQANVFDVQNVATHEFGHWLQLRDLNNPGEAELTMYQPISLRETKKKTLGFGDLLGAKALYP